MQRARVLGTIVLLFAFEQVVAEEALQEVVVTATLRDVDVVDLPASVSVLDRRVLHEPGLQHFSDVLERIPNLNWSGGTSRPRFFQLRGIGELDQYQGAPNPSVGFLIDGIDFSGVGMPATLFDVEQIEVLRGPQGTVYGANALAGLINVKTRDPGQATDVLAEVSGANHDTWSAGVAGGGPISDDVGWRASLQQYRSDGFAHNIYLNRPTDDRDELTAHGKLRVVVGERWRVDLALLYVDIDNGYDAFSVDNSLNMRSDRPGRDAQRSRGGSIETERTGALVDFRALAAYADSAIDYSFDGDWASDSYWGIYAPYDYFSSFDRSRRTWSADLRWLSHAGAELFERLSWVAGIYALDLSEDNDQTDLFENVPYNTLVSRYRATNTAVYGQTDWRLREGMSLQIGLRGEHRTTHYRDSSGGDFDPAESMVGGNVSIKQAIGKDQIAYLTLARGYKAGGFNIGTQVPDQLRTFGAEYLWNLELGTKGTWFEQKLQTAAAIFYSRREREQVARSFQPDPNDPLTYVFITENAARGENAGLEANAILAINQSWSLDGSLALLRTQYIDYRYVDPTTGAVRDLDGRPQAHAPSYEYSLGVMWRHPSGWTARVDGSGKASYYFDTSHDQVSKAYAILNTRLGYEADRWSAFVWGRNLFDRDYSVRGFYFFLDPYVNEPRLYTQRGDGRQIGLTLRWNWLPAH